MSSRRLWAALAVALGAAGAALWLLRPERGDAYLTLPVERGPIEATVSATGTLNPVGLVEVGTYVSGRIESLEVDFNSPVRRGQRIARIDAAPYQVKVQQARANLATARARLQRAGADLRLHANRRERQRELLEQTVIATDQFEAADSAHAQAIAQVEIERAGVAQAEAALEDARVNLGYTEIASPVDGVVLSRNVNVGQTVAASFQTPTLFLIAEDLARMQVVASVNEADIGRVSEDQLARFTVDAYPDRAFEGRVSEIRNSPVSVQNVVTYDVVVEVANADLALKPGMTASVTLVTDDRDSALKIPLRALRFRADREDLPEVGDGAGRRDGRSQVWLLDAEAGPRRLELELGVRNDKEVEVLAGELRAGDRVIIGYQSEP